MSTPIKPAYDAIVIGGGHNGLVCAAYLARGGKSVGLFEASDTVGGAAANTEFHPGFTVSAAAHLIHHLHPKVAAELGLKKHGLALAANHIPTVALAADGRPMVLSADGEATRRSVAVHSAADSEALPAFRARMVKLAGALKPFLTEAPPRLTMDDGWSHRLAFLRLGWSLRKLGREDMREFLRIIAMNVYDLLDEHFESDLLKGALSLDAVLGARLGPRSPHSAFTYLYRLMGETDGKPGAVGVPKGGMGAVSKALAAAAREAGVHIHTGTPVSGIVMENDAATGVVLESGDTVKAGCVVSNADPRTTFFDILGTEHLDTGFVRRIDNIPMRGIAAKLHVALNGLPAFAGLDGAALGGRLLVAPDPMYVESAFNHSKYKEHSAAPVMEITIPTLHDPSLAPEGKHVLSAIIQYAPYDLAGGWDGARDAFADLAIDTIAAYAPDIRERMVAYQLATPADLERAHRMAGGHWHHGDLVLDRFMMLRPVPVWSRYATPIAGLFLCGAGTHPGGGVMGAAGHNAARQILIEETAP